MHSECVNGNSINGSLLSEWRRVYKDCLLFKTLVTDNDEKLRRKFSNNQICQIWWCIPNTSLSCGSKHHCQVRLNRHKNRWRRVLLKVPFASISLTGSMCFLTPEVVSSWILRPALMGLGGCCVAGHVAEIFIIPNVFWNQTETIINHSINHSSFGLFVPFQQTKVHEAISGTGTLAWPGELVGVDMKRDKVDIFWKRL